MYRNREQLATRWAHFFKKRRAYRRRFRFWHHIPHTVLWPACLPGNPIIPRSSGTRHSFGLRPPAGGRLFHTAHTVPVPAPAMQSHPAASVRPCFSLCLRSSSGRHPFHTAHTVPVPAPAMQSHPAASVRPCFSLCLRSSSRRHPFHTAHTVPAGRTRERERASRHRPARRAAPHKPGPVCIMRYRHSALRMVI